jgi:hypothetical protein
MKLLPVPPGVVRHISAAATRLRRRTLPAIAVALSATAIGTAPVPALALTTLPAPGVLLRGRLPTAEHMRNGRLHNGSWNSSSLT